MPLTQSTIAAASLSSPNKQNDLIDHAKTLGEALLQLIYASKESGGNPNFKSAHEHVENSVALVNEAINDFKVRSMMVNSNSKKCYSLKIKLENIKTGYIFLEGYFILARSVLVYAIILKFWALI